MNNFKGLIQRKHAASRLLQLIFFAIYFSIFIFFQRIFDGKSVKTKSEIKMFSKLIL